jgi:hypothetical protein
MARGDINMIDATAGELPIEPIAAPAEAAPPSAEATAERVLPDIEHPIGAIRQAILDHLVDSEGPQTVAQFIAALGNVSRGTVETALKREFDVGRIERVAPGVYRLAPPQAPDPPKAAAPPEPEPVRSDGMTDQMWFGALEACFLDPISWNEEEFGPSPDRPNHRIPPDIKLRFNDRLRKREERRRERDAAAARQAAADAELRNELLATCRGNFTPGPGIDDMSPIKAILELVPVDYILYAIRQKVDKRCFPGNPPLASWRDPKFLRAVADNYCGGVVIPSMVAAWEAAGKAPATKAHGSSPPAAARERVEPSPAVQVPPDQENAPMAPPGNGIAPSGDSAAEPGPPAAVQVPAAPESDDEKDADDR